MRVRVRRFYFLGAGVARERLTVRLEEGEVLEEAASPWERDVRLECLGEGVGEFFRDATFSSSSSRF